MNYRIANADEDLGSHPLKRLREAFATEEAAQKISVLVDGGWVPLWPWLQQQHSTDQRTKSALFRRVNEAGLVVVLLRIAAALALLGAGFNLVGFFVLRTEALFTSAFTMLGVALVIWVPAAALDLLAKIERNTRR
jgi:hypothetical protein